MHCLLGQGEILLLTPMDYLVERSLVWPVGSLGIIHTILFFYNIEILKNVFESKRDMTN